MTSKRIVQLIAVIGLFALTLPLTQGWTAEHRLKASKTPSVTLEQLHAKQIPLALKSLASLTKSVEAGHKELALMELKKVQDLLAIVHQTVGQHVKSAFANAVCPIMGAKINPANVPASLIREFKGQPVAFCCAGCPDRWDKLSNVQKRDLLMKTKRSATRQHQH